jgi:hypothetical protein
LITARNLHAKLAILGARFLYQQACELVACEFSTSMNGLPGELVFDAVGLDFTRRQVRVLEAKTSRSDFLADDRIADGYGHVADQCWLICPDGLVLPEELPDRWGLLYFCPDVAELTYLQGARRLRRRVRLGEVQSTRTELGTAWRRTRKPGEGCLVARQARRLVPEAPLSSHWDAMVRAVSRKLTRSTLGIQYRNGKPAPQPVECLEL